jgi:hypothetical protein
LVGESDGTGGALSLGEELKMSSNFTRTNPKVFGRGGAIKVFTVSASPSGQVMLLICVAVFALMGMIGVVADFSFLQHQKEHDADRGG